MSQANDSRLQSQTGDRHPDGRPYHYATLSQDDRIRKIFGLAEDAALPPVSDQTLGEYYDYLKANLSVPFDALFCLVGGDSRQLIHYVCITALSDPRDGRKHNRYGLFCEAKNATEVLEVPLVELGVRDDSPNCQLIDDYAYWFVNGH